MTRDHKAAHAQLKYETAFENAKRLVSKWLSGKQELDELEDLIAQAIVKGYRGQRKLHCPYCSDDTLMLKCTECSSVFSLDNPILRDTKRKDKK